MKIFECANCFKDTYSLFRDKVSNKLVCSDCMDEAVELGVRFYFDFDGVKD